MARELPGPSDAEIDAFLSARLQPFGITLDQLRQGPVRAPGHADVAFADLRFPTPSGKIELESEEARRRWELDRLPDYTEPVESNRSRLAEAPRDALHLLTPNTKNFIHSQFGNLPSIRALNPRPVLLIHPDDGVRRGVKAGGTVRVFNGRGELRVEARWDYGLKPGCVVIHNGWWMTDQGAVNVLSKARETDMGYGAAFHENLVQVEPA